MVTAACAGAAPITIAAISDHPSAERHALDVFLSWRPLAVVVSAENPFSEATVLGFSGLINWGSLAKCMRTEPLSVGQGRPFRKRGDVGRLAKRAAGGAYEARLRRVATLGCAPPPFRG